MRTLYAAAMITLLFGGSCDYFWMGSYTGQCDEPKTLYVSGQDPEQLRVAQCQVQGNICCRHPDNLTKQIGKNHQTYCLLPSECYLAGDGASCLGDVDCMTSLTCVGGNTSTNVFGVCACPNGGIACTSSAGAITCCSKTMICNDEGACATPEPDMSVLPDMSVRG